MLAGERRVSIRAAPSMAVAKQWNTFIHGGYRHDLEDDDVCTERKE